MRAKETAEREQQRRMQEDLMRARIAQREEKVRSVQEEKENERASAERFRREYEVQLELERARLEARREAAVAHKQDLIVQIQRGGETSR